MRKGLHREAEHTFTMCSKGEGSKRGRCSDEWEASVRESPPPTPREAYLPQRPERTQKEGGIRDEIDPSPSRSKSSQDKAEPQTAELTQRPEGVEEGARPGDPTEKEAKSGSDPKSLTRLRKYKCVST